MLKPPLFLDDPPPVSPGVVAGLAAGRSTAGASPDDVYPVPAPETGLHVSPGETTVMLGQYALCRVNGGAAEILGLLDGQSSLATLAAELARRHGDTVPRVLAVLSGFLAAAAGRGLLGLSPHPVARQIPLSGSREWPAPYAVSLELTRACDLRCRHCYASAGETAGNELSTAEWLSVAATLAQGCARVSLTGGDPLARPDIGRIVGHLVRCGIRVKLLTTGTRLDEPTADWLAGCGLDAVHISLDGSTAAMHESLRRVKGSFAAATTAIGTLAGRGLHVVASMTVTPDSTSDVPRAAALARSLGARSLLVGWVRRRGRARGSGLVLEESDFARLLEALNLAAQQTGDGDFAVAFEVSPDWRTTFPGGCPSVTRYIIYRDRFVRGARGNCGAGRLVAAVSATGEVRPCPVSQVVLGAARSGEGLAAALRSERARIFGSIVAPGPTRCGDCEHLFRCVGCHAEACEYGPEVPGCRWAMQVHQAGGDASDFWHSAGA